MQIKAFLQTMCFFPANISHINNICCWLVMSTFMQNINTGLWKSDPYIFMHHGQFFWAFTLWTKASTNHSGCVERMSRLSPTTTSTTTESLTQSQHNIITSLWLFNSLCKSSRRPSVCTDASCQLLHRDVLMYLEAVMPQTFTHFLAKRMDYVCSCLGTGEKAPNVALGQTQSFVLTACKC